MGGQLPEVKEIRSERRGSSCAVPAVNLRTPAAVQTMLEQYLVVNGARLFNSLSKSLRDCDESLDQFKRGLDSYLRGYLTSHIFHTTTCPCWVIACWLTIFKDTCRLLSLPRRYTCFLSGESAPVGKGGGLMCSGGAPAWPGPDAWT